MSHNIGSFFCCGTNHKNTSLELRESLYLSPDQISYALPKIQEAHRLPELAVLSTCNRLEMYGICHELGKTGTVQKISRAYLDLQVIANKTKPTKDGSTIFCYAGENAIRHAYAVAASVDSLIIGEAQITGQFKKAFAIAQEVCTLGPHLFQLSQSALNVAKKVRSQTAIGRKTVSIGHAAIDLARRIFTNLADKKILLVGAGEMARVTAFYAKKLGIQDVVIVNRSVERAQEFAHDLGLGKVCFMSELPNLLAQVDIVITAMSTDEPIITTSMLKEFVNGRKNKPIYIVDIGFPRNVELGCGQFEDVYLFELDDLQDFVSENLSERQSASVEADKIIEGSLEHFCRKISEKAQSENIATYRKYLEELIFKESQKTFNRKELRQLDEKQLEALQVMLSSISQKLTADFAIALKKNTSTKLSLL